ncbi:hypothetical protein HHA02_24260 [Cobetia marina]|nr:hypothetical protein HHA02_24260 [Cobetia marina]
MHREDVHADLVTQALQQKFRLMLVDGAAMHQQARRLLHHHQHVILKQDVEWQDGLGLVSRVSIEGRRHEWSRRH